MAFARVYYPETSIQLNNSIAGERIEEKIERISVNKEPIQDGAPIVYTERSEGVRADTNIRTDRFELAIDAMDKVAQAKLTKRDERLKALKGGKDPNGNEGAAGGGTPANTSDQNQ